MVKTIYLGNTLFWKAFNYKWFNVQIGVLKRKYKFFELSYFFLLQTWCRASAHRGWDAIDRLLVVQIEEKFEEEVFNNRI